MARLFKPTITRYVDPQGHRCKKCDAGARQKRMQSKTWRGQFRDLDGIVQDVKLCTNKDAARQVLNAMELATQRGEVGRLQDHRQRPLLQHIEDYS